MSLDLTQLKNDYKEPSYKAEKKTDEQYESLKRNIGKSFESIGIYIDEKGFDRTKSGKPRFYVLLGNGQFKNALENGEDVRSEEFLDKLAKGNVYTFPAGEKNRCRSQSKVPRSNSASLWKASVPMRPRSRSCRRVRSDRRSRNR